MIITEIRKSRAKGTYAVVVDSDRQYVISEDYLASAAIRVGDRVCADHLSNLQLEEERTRARTVSLRYLSVRARSEKEIERRLEKEDLSRETIVEVIDWLKGLGYIDDMQFARDWVSGRSKRMKVGSRRLYNELLVKGVDDVVIKCALEAIDEDDEYALALEAARKRKNQLEYVEPLKARRRLYGYLLRRGFSGHIVRKVTEQILD